MKIFLKCLLLLVEMENTPKRKKKLYIYIEEIYNKYQVASTNMFCIP
jgi:hypothetical protein